MSGPGPGVGLVDGAVPLAPASITGVRSAWDQLLDAVEPDPEPSPCCAHDPLSVPWTAACDRTRIARPSSPPRGKRRLSQARARAAPQSAHEPRRTTTCSLVISRARRQLALSAGCLPGPCTAAAAAGVRNQAAQGTTLDCRERLHNTPSVGDNRRYGGNEQQADDCGRGVFRGPPPGARLRRRHGGAFLLPGARHTAPCRRRFTQAESTPGEQSGGSGRGASRLRPLHSAAGAERPPARGTGA